VVDNPTAPVLATVKGVELASVGYWNISNADDWHPSADDLAAAIAALDCPAVRRPILKFGHTGVPGEGDPAIGLIDNLTLTEDGNTLVGDFVGVPGWLANADSEGRSVLASAYPDRSGEFEHNYVCQLGHTHPFVLHAMSLLGVMRPGIGTLESLYDLYTKAPELEESVMAKATAVEASTTVDQVRKAYYAGPGTNWDLWIREMYVDPPELIVQNDADDSVERIPYTMSGDGEVEFGDPQKVKVEYVAARAASEKPQYACATRVESRPTRTPSAAEAEVTEGKEPTVATLNEGVSQRLGIPADADEDTILQALDEALAERVDPTTPEGDPAPESEPEPVPVAASTRTDTVTVDRAQWEATIADATAGREARAQQIRESDESLVSAAIADGRIAPARRQHWLASLAADRQGVTEVINGLEKGLIPTAEVGHASVSDSDSTEYAWPGEPVVKG
jgi:hypothetical protein